MSGWGGEWMERSVQNDVLNCVGSARGGFTLSPAPSALPLGLAVLAFQFERELQKPALSLVYKGITISVNRS